MHSTGNDCFSRSGESKIAPGERRQWNFQTLHDLHVRATSLLRQAILNERYKRWRKVIDSYLELLWVISLDHLPEDYEPPSSYSLLLYELNFHLGVAYQHLGNHKKAVKYFTKTIEVVSIAKNGCLAGCLTNSCLMTPIYARRAFAHAKLGSYKQSLKDAEKAVVLDSKSPDVYCIRALVRSSFDDEMMGLQDLNTALKFDSEHVCAMVLKASLTKPLVHDEDGHGCNGKVIRLCQEAETYLTCNSFHHPCIMEFYDKFLFPLSIPHTITTINMTPEKPKASKMYQDSTDGQQAFRCGAPLNTQINRDSWKRRTDYGEAIRKFMSRPKSAAEFFKQLETHRRRQASVRRAETALVRPGHKFATAGLRKPEYAEIGSDASGPLDSVENIRPATAPADFRSKTGNSKFKSPDLRPATTNTGIKPMHSTPKRPVAPVHGDSDNNNKPPPKSPASKKIVIETPSDYSIPVFQSVNIKFAPRMYYRPWTGDKLPVAERQKFDFTPAFY